MRTPFLADPVFKTQQLFGLPVGRVRRPMLCDGLRDPDATGLPHPVVPIIILAAVGGQSNGLRKSSPAVHRRAGRRGKNACLTESIDNLGYFHRKGIPFNRVLSLFGPAPDVNIGATFTNSPKGDCFPIGKTKELPL